MRFGELPSDPCAFWLRALRAWRNSLEPTVTRSLRRHLALKDSDYEGL